LVLLFLTLSSEEQQDNDHEYYYRYTMEYYNNPTHVAPSCFEKGTCAVENYEKLCRTNPHKRITFLLWTRQNNFGASCPALLEKISNPCSPDYGKYLSFDEIRKLTYDKYAIKGIIKYLKSLGILDTDIVVAPNGEYIEVTASVSTIEKLFDTKMYDFRSDANGEIYTTSSSYTIPPEIQLLTQGATGTTTTTTSTTPPPPPRTPPAPPASPTPTPSVKRSVQVVEEVEERRNSDRSQNPGYTTPAVIRATYNVPNQDVYRDLVSQSVFATSAQSFLPDDLTLFQDRNSLPFNSVYNITGPNDPEVCSSDSAKCSEGNLDIQFIGSLARNAKTWFWSVPADLGFNPYLRWISDLVTDPNPPDVHVISYGNDEEFSDPTDIYRFNDELCKLGLRGITVVASSGDYGVAGLQCGNLNDPERCGFHPMFPAACPFLTSVGATMGPENNTDEISASFDSGSLATSGGGFSRIFSRPAWQNKAVKTYLEKHNDVKPETFAVHGRGYPDVAVLANNYEIIVNKEIWYVSGTSAAAPTFASLITLLNSYRVANGRPKLGFLNPLLYHYFYASKTPSFNDIVDGTNRCCSQREHLLGAACCPIGFRTAEGWDPVSGLGSLDYQRFKKFLDGI